MKKIFLKLFAPLFLVLLIYGCSTAKQGEIAEDEIAEEITSETAELEYYPWIDSDLKENIKKDMKISVKDDFHLAVNYDWLLKTEIKAGRTSTFPFLDIEEITMNKAKSLLNDKTLKSHDAALVQDFYWAFLDWDSRNEIGMKPIISVIKDIEGIESISGLSEFICDLERSFGVPTFFTAENIIDSNDSSSYILWFGSEDFILGDAAEYSGRTAIGDRYYNAKKLAFSAIAERIGYKKNDAESLFDIAIGLESKIAEVSLSYDEKMRTEIFYKINNVMTLDELCAIAPNFPIEKFLDSMGYGAAEKILVEKPAVIECVSELFSESDLNDIKSYMIVKYIFEIMAALDRYSYEIMISMNNAIVGGGGKKSDEDIAYEIVKDCLGVPIARVYLEKYDSAKLKKEITEICENIIKSYRKMLDEEIWLSEETRRMAIAKLDAMKINAVYPDKWEDYSALELHGLSYFEMLKALNGFYLKQDAARTNQKVDKDLWTVNILDSNAFYSWQENSINIILGLLDGVLYRDGITKEELYGGIGVIIAHEISHAFDTDGAQFDKDGIFFDWWQEDDYAAFMERADKLAVYYDQIIPFKNAKVAGSKVQAEAIADMAGLKCILAIAKDEENFNYDAFFRQLATIWRRLNTPRTESFLLAQDEHPLQYLRTNVTLQQFDEFLQTYDIKEGDGMYLAPENRVLVW